MAHQSRLACFVIDCKADALDEAARFWGAALGYEIARDPTDTNYATIVTPDDQPKMLLQAVSQDSRIHLDIETDDKEAEAARLTRLGAWEVARYPRWIVMEAPTGHRFCVVNPQRADVKAKAKVQT